MWCPYFADIGDDLHLATYRGDGVEKYWLEDDAVGSACKVRNLGELIEEPGKQKGQEEQREEDRGVMCYDRIKQNV